MKEKTKLRVIQILCIVSLLITVFSIQKTYAKYYERIDTNYVTNIKRWVINVNGSKIHSGVELSQIMQPVFRENEHMNSNNTLVPGREGYFEFLIDYSKVDVKFKFEFDIKQLNDTPLEDFEIYGYSIVEGEGENATETPTSITVNNLSELTQIIDPDNDEDLNANNEPKRLIRILFRWNDANADTEDADSVDGMNNHEDTVFTGEENTAEDADGIHKVLNYKVRITFTQKIG